MNKTSLRAALVALAAAGSLLASPLASSSTAATSTKPPTQFGMSYGERLSRMSATDLAATLDDAKALGVTWVRADLSWTTVQNGGRTSWDWSGFDRVVAATKARGLDVLPILAYTPAWARDSGCYKFSCPPRSATDFAAFASAAVKRYSSYGVRTWEVWNEPNLAQFWPKPDPVRYATLLKATSKAVKAADPGAKVLLGGLAALENSAPSIGPREYLTAVCVAGACGSFDAVSYHPYTFPFPSSYYATWSAWSKITATPLSLASILTKYGVGAKPIWVTEYGAPTAGNGTAVDGTWASLTSTADHVTEGWQASLATDAVQQAVANPKVVAFFWYTNQDLVASTRRESSFGLRRLDGTPKPSWSAFRQAVAAARPTS
jgi:arabinogalactan endo-1,4-beta-galactosidase